MKHLMKKAVKVAVFAALTTLALTAFASAQGEMAIGAGCTTGTSLRMRSEPNTSSRHRHHAEQVCGRGPAG